MLQDQTFFQQCQVCKCQIEKVQHIYAIFHLINFDILLTNKFGNDVLL